GLHFDDLRKLLHVLDRLVDAGNTVIVIEHNLDVVRCADWVIDLGPEGGAAGGRVVASGTPETVARCAEGHTGTFSLRKGGGLVDAPGGMAGRDERRLPLLSHLPAFLSGSVSSSGGSDAGGGLISVVAQGGQIDVAQLVDLSGGEFDGGELDLIASGDVIVRQDINVNGGGLSGSGGTVFIAAGGTATVLGNIDGTAAGSSSEGGGDGADVEIDGDQDVVVNGQVDVTCGFPDGSGGPVSSTVGGNVTPKPKITLLGAGGGARGGGRGA